jgi:trk system potassium uptake protein TrkH
MKINRIQLHHLIVQRILKITPSALLAMGFVIFILLGAILLWLPAANQEGRIQWIDALFTATSAVCVTGLAVVDTGSTFNLFGQWVIIVLMQVGGLGVMTFSVMLYSAIGRSISFRQRMALQETFAHTNREDIVKLIKTVIMFTMIVEGGGALLLFSRWVFSMPFDQAAHYAIFHSIAAFCNAGFALFPDNLVRYSGDWLVCLTVCVSIVLGGIGFPVVHDIYNRIKDHNHRRYRFSVQTKTVLITTAFLIVVGAVVFYMVEHRHLLYDRPIDEAILIALFQSITARTAGFNTVDIGLLNNATLMMITTLMFFGASPGSTGGGVKTTTLALIGAFTWSRVRRKKRVDLFKKSIPTETVSRSVSLILVCIGFVGTVLFLVLLGDALGIGTGPGVDNRFIVYLFEAISAFGTVGLSMGITPHLSTWGKSLIMLLMLVGRVGILTFAYIVIGGGITNGIEHSEENIMIG